MEQHIVYCLDDDLIFTYYMATVISIERTVPEKGSVNCPDLGLCHSDKDTLCGKGADDPHQTWPLLNTPRGSSEETQQPWRQLVPGRLLLIWDIMLQGPSSDRVRALP